MRWIKHYHEDHLAVLQLLAKLEGNIRDVETGERRQYLYTELEEFADIIKNVIKPHFKGEETGIYARISEVSEKERDFIKLMLKEHEELYKAFDEYLDAINSPDDAKLIASARVIIRVLEKHIKKEEKVVPEIARKLGIEIIS